MMNYRRTKKSAQSSSKKSSYAYIPHTVYIQKIRSGVIEPVYILLGTEHPGKNEFIAELKTTDDYKFEEFSMPESVTQTAEKVNDFLTKVFTPSLWGDKMLLIIYDFQNIAAKSQKDILNRLTTLPKNYFARVVLESKYSKALQMLFAEYNFTTINFFQPDERIIVHYIFEMAKSIGLVIDTEAAKMLIEMIGTDFNLINQELEKIKTYLGAEKPRITADTVLNACGYTKESSIDDLVNAVFWRDIKQSISNLYRLQNEYVMPVMIVGYLANAGFQILQIALGASQKAIGTGNLGLKRYEILTRQSRQWTSKELTSFLLELSKIDKKIKTGYSEPYVLLESLLIKSGRN